MTWQKTQHRTIVLSHIFPAPASTLFALLSDPRERQDLGAASGKLIFVLDQADFCVGGCDTFRFGRKMPVFHGRTIYHDIRPDTRIVATETVTFEDHCLSTILTTLDLTETGPRTNLRFTAQIVTLDHADLYPESTIRAETLIENLVRHLARQPRP